MALPSLPPIRTLELGHPIPPLGMRHPLANELVELVLLVFRLGSSIVNSARRRSRNGRRASGPQDARGIGRDDVGEAGVHLSEEDAARVEGVVVESRRKVVEGEGGEGKGFPGCVQRVSCRRREEEGRTHEKTLSMFQMVMNESNWLAGTRRSRLGTGLGGSVGSSELTRRRMRPSWIDMGSRSRSSMGYLMGRLGSCGLRSPRGVES